MRRALFLVLVVILCSVAPRPSTAASAADLEYDVKAAYLFNLANFTQWPAAAFDSDGAPFRICVAVPDPFHDTLTRTFQGERIAGHPATVVTIRRSADVAGCHILFIGAAVEPEAGLLQAAAASAVLTVGETPAFEHRGGIITFVLDSGKVRFTVNQAAASRAGLRLSSKVLQVALNHRTHP